MNATNSLEINSTKEHISVKQLNDMIASSRIISTVILCILLVVGVIGNSLVLSIYGLFLKKSEERFFIPFLAFFDICALVAGTIFAIIQNMYKVAFPSLVLCKIIFFFASMTSTISACLLLVVAINRYLKICRPYWTQMDIRRKMLSLLIVIVFAVSLASPLFYFLDDYQDEIIYKSQRIVIRTCQFSPTESRFGGNVNLKLAFFAVLLSLTILNLVITIALYILIGKEVFFRFSSIRKSSVPNNQRAEIDNDEREIETDENIAADKSSGRESRKLDTEKSSQNFELCTKESDTGNNSINKTRSLDRITTRTRRNPTLTTSNTSTIRRKNRGRRRVRQNFTIMFMTIVLIYVISYIPTVVLTTILNRIEYWISLSPGKLTILLVLRRMFLLNHVVNPFIYGYFDLTFREKFQHILKCFQMRKK